MKILSISVAAYNVEKYLEQTLRSFCITEIIEDIEILIVDDGSSDGTELIAKRFENEYPETFRYIKKENGGHGSTVNKAIELASGQYFKVVDGDDWVSRSDFIELIQYLKTSGVDLVLTDFCRVYGDASKKTEYYFKCFQARKVYYIHSMPRIESIAMHSIAVKTKLLQENNIRLTENCFYVDIEYVVYILYRVNTVVYLPTNVYMYRYGTQNQSVSVKNMRQNIAMREKITLGLLEYLKLCQCTNDVDEHRMTLMEDKVVRMVTGTILVYLTFSDIRTARNQLKRYDHKVKMLLPQIFYRTDKNWKVKLMRHPKYMLFGIMNLFYRKLKMIND